MKPISDHITSVEFVTLWSKNLAKSREFYIDRLGFSLLRERAGEFFQFDIASLPVCVDCHPERSGNEANQIGVRVSDLDATAAILDGMEFEVKRGEQEEASERWVAIKDPDGHELIFIATLG